MSVKAKDLGTQKEQTIVIQSNSGLTDEEIDRMMKDAEANAEADKKRKEEVDLRNEVDQAIFATERLSRKLKEKVSTQNVTLPKLPLMTLRKRKKTITWTTWKQNLKHWTKKLKGLAVKLYEQAAAAQQAQAGAEGAQATGNAGDDVVDGEFTEK